MSVWRKRWFWEKNNGVLTFTIGSNERSEGGEGGGLLRERGGYLKGLVVERKGRGR